MAVVLSFKGTAIFLSFNVARTFTRWLLSSYCLSPVNSVSCWLWVNDLAKVGVDASSPVSLSKNKFQLRR
ncbi:hypothetical protein GA0116948_107196 [Chitinophaga costaii]|uniref:Uncharacterized protein n=1 Tax=Chitinophaga costaii TaxID=1335309 RepID=A0A1C4E9Q3_9BACT|nr:hypothetical protein GA0116948_107196 [Chitinophaga costaii]